ncbi:MAG: methionyl-tRNA formyltransferase [Muribaculaceae bacterium]|nr:methionyl-tRNA formyltransferase [Muribaculaceae bacterium]
MDYKDIKIVFFGTPEFAVASLEALLDAGCDIKAVVTAPDKPAGRGHKLLQSEVKEYALSKGLPVLQPVNLKAEEFQSELRAIGADLFIVIAFRMLPQSVWAMPRLGTFNVHGSLLPRYRGAAPINRAIMNGETKTGVSTFFLTHEIDTGNVIGRRETPIAPEDNVGTVYDRLMRMGAELAVDTVKDIAAGNVKPVAQSELEDELTPCPAPKIFKEDCRIDWSRPAVEIHNQVRGLSPYPAAWSELSDDSTDTTFKIYETAVSATAATAPGTITVDNGRMWVDCGDVRLEILSLQLQGKKRMKTADYLRGSRLSRPVCK